LGRHGDRPSKSLSAKIRVIDAVNLGAGALAAQLVSKLDKGR
jgi:hypothetical protein